MFLSGFLAVYGGGIILKANSSRFWIHAVTAMTIALFIVGPQVYRNMHKFGSPIGPASQLNVTVEPTWRSTLFNAARNLGSNIDIEAVGTWIAWAGRALNVSDTDKRYSFFGHPFKAFYDDTQRQHEDYAPNTVHVIVLLLSIVSFSLIGLISTNGPARFVSLARYGLAATLSFLAFCILLKWQPWITRLQLGGFVLVTPLAAVLVSQVTMACAVLIVLLALQAFPALFHNKLRPIIGPQSIISASPVDAMFRNRPDFQPGYMKLAAEIAALRPQQIGLLFGGDSWEFPLWYLLRKRLPISDMPVIIHELNEQAIDPRSDIVVYFNKEPSLVPHGMIEVQDFHPFRFYKRIR